MTRTKARSIDLKSELRPIYWRLARLAAAALAIPGRIYAAVYTALKLNVVSHRLGVQPARQIDFMPRQLRVSRRLMHQPYTVRVADIRWGGRLAEAFSKPATGQGRGFRIFDGDWDAEDKRPIEDYLSRYIYSSTIIRIYRDGVPYRETDQYREIANAVARGRFDDWRARGCRSDDDITRYFEDLDRIFQSIRAGGYRSQTELGSPTWWDEIKVFIDRNGELHKRAGAGHHRLAMARLLGIETVPVLVIGIHKRAALAAQREIGRDVITSIDIKIRRDIACA